VPAEPGKSEHFPHPRRDTLPKEQRESVTARPVPEGEALKDKPGSSLLFVGVVAALLVFLMAARTPLDTDLWWHLRAGAETLRLGQPVLVDTLSYTRAGEAWINHSWLAEVLMTLLFRWAGFLGLGLAVAGLAAFSLAWVYRQSYGPALWRAFVVILAALVIAPVWSARPQILSLVCLVAVNQIVIDFQNGKGRLFWLVPLFVLWSNLHGGYVLGLILLGSALAGGALERLLKQEDAPSWKALLELGGWTLAGAAAVLVNPNGLNMWRIPFQTVGVEVLQQAIPEWASPDFHQAVQLPFLLLLVGLIGALGLAGKALRVGEVLKLVLFATLGLVARRNFGPFALLAAPIFAQAGWMVIERAMNGLRIGKKGVSGSRDLPVGVQKAFNLVIVALLALAAFGKLFVVTQPSLVGMYEQQSFPTGAVNWLKQNQPQGRLFNAYEWGGYLTWRLPEYPVFVDGRTDLFGDEIIGEWLKVVKAEPGWETVLEGWKVQLVLLPPGYPLVGEIERAGWRMLYSDDLAVLYQKR
jgi:hypothetical protein